MLRSVLVYLHRSHRNNTMYLSEIIKQILNDKTVNEHG